MSRAADCDSSMGVSILHLASRALGSVSPLSRRVHPHFPPALLLPLALCLLFPISCRFPGNVKPTVKVGLSAPFEGTYRDLGYEALHAVRLAVRERNRAGGVGERYLVELVALNDFNEVEEALLQARKMAADPGVLGVLGGWSPDIAQRAAPEYQRLGLAFLAPHRELDGSPPGFLEGYQELSGGVPPGPVAAWAYTAAQRLLDALEAAARADGQPTRAGVQAALATSQD